MFVATAFAVVFILIGYLLGNLFSLNNLQNQAFMLAVLALGLLLGMLFDWLIEEAHRRNRELLRQVDDYRLTQPPMQTTQVERIIERVQQHLPMLATQALQPPEAESSNQTQYLLNFLRERDDQILVLRDQLRQTEEKIHAIRADFDHYIRAHPDDLTVIDGIGPVFQWKLRDLGINTFDQLAKSEPEKLGRMLNIKNWQKVNIESWIAQSKDWAQRG
jgi:predicted flap endonuclease-1-like 5' DNA nuclease